MMAAGDERADDVLLFRHEFIEAVLILPFLSLFGQHPSSLCIAIFTFKFTFFTSFLYAVLFTSLFASLSLCTETLTTVALMVCTSVEEQQQLSDVVTTD